MNSNTLKYATAILSAAIIDKNDRDEAIERLLTPRPDRPTRDKMLTTRAACQMAGVHPKTLFRWEEKGYLHPKRITPSRIRWSRTELETFLCETADA